MTNVHSSMSLSFSGIAKVPLIKQCFVALFLTAGNQRRHFPKLPLIGDELPAPASLIEGIYLIMYA